ncbi:MAG: 2-C-methyl-D-erythritol 4-phosphate cytidylyltransferase [Lachnospiraceae bacterium]|nr:2-C-methyl-D-erythritol 4-phosphate cytidylyltransferase [Lachnospiraceae bacterium]
MKTAIVLAAGQGKRMGSDVAKQYMLLQGKPVLFYALDNFQNSIIDEIVLVTSEDQIAYCREEIVERYGFDKVKRIVAGGKERYHSVAAGLAAANPKTEFVFIHDGARPFADPKIIQRGYACVKEHRACVVAMPVKDTIKIADEDGFVTDTPRRDLVWQMQTPQIFSFHIIKEAYDTLLAEEEQLLKEHVSITDDAMVLERYSDIPVKLVKGSYENVKITTPEDMEIAETFLKKSQENREKDIDTKNRFC